jgi:tetratricopeptide (TPR) repeat protein
MLMKTRIPVLKQILGCVVVIILMTGTAKADEASNLFHIGIKNYNSGEFKAAVSEFSEIVNRGIVNGKLFYDLGNAYLKNNDIGHAILWYQRAFKLIPKDPDLKFNYTVALSRVKDMPPDNRHPILKIIVFWQYLLSRTATQWAAVILNGIFWIVLTLQLFFRKNTFNWVRSMILPVFMIILLTASFNYYDDTYNKQAVIIPPEISVRSGLSDDATELFALHAGSQVHVDKEKDGFLKVRFSKDKIGWIKKTDAQVI